MPRELEIVTTIYARPNRSSNRDKDANNEKLQASKPAASRKSPAFDAESRQLMAEMKELQAKLGQLDGDIASTYRSSKATIKRAADSRSRHQGGASKSPEKRKASPSGILQRPTVTRIPKRPEKDEHYTDYRQSNAERILTRRGGDSDNTLLYQHLYGLQSAPPTSKLVAAAKARSHSADEIIGSERGVTKPLSQAAAQPKGKVTPRNDNEIKSVSADAVQRTPENQPPLTVTPATVDRRRGSSTPASVTSRNDSPTQPQQLEGAESPGSVTPKASSQVIHDHDGGLEIKGDVLTTSGNLSSSRSNLHVLEDSRKARPVQRSLSKEGLCEIGNDPAKDSIAGQSAATPSADDAREGEEPDVPNEPRLANAEPTIVKGVDDGGSQPRTGELEQQQDKQEQRKKKAWLDKKRHYDVQQVREFMRTRQVEQRSKEQQSRAAREQALLHKQARLRELESHAKLLLQQGPKCPSSKKKVAAPSRTQAGSLDWGPRPHTWDADVHAVTALSSVRHIPPSKVDHAVQTQECGQSSQQTQTPNPQHSVAPTPSTAWSTPSPTGSAAREQNLGSLMRQIQDLDRLINSVMETETSRPVIAARKPSVCEPEPHVAVREPLMSPADQVDGPRWLLDMTASTKYKEMPPSLAGLLAASETLFAAQRDVITRKDEQTQTSRSEGKPSGRPRMDTSTPQKPPLEFFREDLETRSPRINDSPPSVNTTAVPELSCHSPVVHKSPYNIMTALRHKLQPYEKCSAALDTSVSQGPLSSISSAHSEDQSREQHEFNDLEVEYTSFETLRTSTSPGASSVDTLVTSCHLQNSFGSPHLVPKSPVLSQIAPDERQDRDQNFSQSTLEQVESVAEEVVSVCRHGTESGSPPQGVERAPKNAESVSVQFPSLGKSRAWEAQSVIVTEERQPAAEAPPLQPSQPKLAPTSLFMRLKAELNRGEGLDQVLKNLTELERLRSTFPRPNTIPEPSLQQNGEQVAQQLEQKMESMQQRFDNKLEAWLQKLLASKNEHVKDAEAAAAAQKALKEIQSLTEGDSVAESLPPVIDSGGSSSDGDAWTQKRKKTPRQTMDTSVSSQGTVIGTDMSSLSQLPEAVEILLAEEARQQRLLLKLREKSRVERTLDELELLQIQKRILRAQGEKEKAVSIKKRQRGLLMKLHEERAEIERLRQTHKKEVENRLRRLQKAQPSSTNTKHGLSRESKSFSSSWETESSVTSVAPPPEAPTEPRSPVESVGSAPVAEQLSEVRDSIAESINEETPTANSSAVSLPEENASEIASYNSVSGTGSAKLQVKLKSPLSPRPPGQQAFRTWSRNRHSSGSDESVTFSQAETLSDVSDVEGRVVALTEELKLRQAEAAKLKEDQKKAKREKLKAQETSLLKQIEAYDKLINQVRRELEHETKENSVGIAVKPQIKRPKGKTRPPPKEVSECSEDISNASTTASCKISESLSAVVTEESVPESQASERKDGNLEPLNTAEKELSLSESRARANLPESPEIVGSEESVSESFATASVSESLHAVELENSVTKSQAELDQEFKKEGVEIIEIVEIVEEKTSVVLEITEESSAEETGVSLEEERSSVTPKISPVPEPHDETEISEEESSTLTESHPVESYSAPPWANNYVENLTQNLLQESITAIFAVRAKKAESQLQYDQHAQDATRLVLQRVSALLEAEQLQEYQQISPRSKPSSLYTMTYDVISPDWSPPPGSPPSGSPPFNQEWFDDDLGFSTPLGPPLSHAARLEAQKIEKEKQRIEEEIQQLVSQVSPSSPAPFYREIPNKPPPPYTPPGAWTTPPSTKSTALKTVGIFQSKEKILAFCSRCFQELLKEWRTSEVLVAEFDHQLVPAEEEQEQAEFVSAYHHFLFDLTKHFLLEIGTGLKWLPPLEGYTSKWRRREVLASEEQLWRAVEQQLMVELSFNSRYKKPSRALKWCHKKRDRVDEVLVYELQVEEREWTDFGLDEKLVKDQTFEALWEQVMGETVQWLDQLWNRRV